MDFEDIEYSLLSDNREERAKALQDLLYVIKRNGYQHTLLDVVKLSIQAVNDDNALVQMHSLEVLRASLAHDYPLHVDGSLCRRLIFCCLQNGSRFKSLGKDIILHLIESGQQDQALQQLLLMLEDPDTRAGCVEALAEALRKFGTKVVSTTSIKSAIQILQRSHYKDEMTEPFQLLMEEACKWFGPSVLRWILPHNNNIREATRIILEARSPNRAKPVRFQKTFIDCSLKKIENHQFTMARAKYKGNIDQAISGYRSSGVNGKEAMFKDILDFAQNWTKVEEEEARKTYAACCQTLKWVLENEKHNCLLLKAVNCVCFMAEFPGDWFCSHAQQFICLLLRKFPTGRTSEVIFREVLDKCFSSVSIQTSIITDAEFKNKINF